MEVSTHNVEKQQDQAFIYLPCLGLLGLSFGFTQLLYGGIGGRIIILHISPFGQSESFLHLLSRGSLIPFELSLSSIDSIKYSKIKYCFTQIYEKSLNDEM